MSEVDIPDKYSSLKQRIGAMDMPPSPAFETILPIVNTLKSVIAADPKEWTNNAHVAYNTGWIKDVSGGTLLPVLRQQAARPDLSPEDKQKVENAVNEVKAMHEDAKQLSKQSEPLTTPDNVSDEVGDYVNAASCSQIIFDEIKRMGEELNGEADLEKVNEIAHSIIDKAPELGKPVGSAPQSIASRFKDAFGRFKTALEKQLGGLAGRIVGIAGEVKGILTSLLKKAADLLQEFFSRLVSAFFGFASWIQKMAVKNNFSMKEISVELPTFEFTTMMVGPYPLPVPKLTTPKLTATFIPVPPMPDKKP